MLIGIDARMYGGKQTGIGNYIRNLTDKLFQIDKNNHYILFLQEPEFSHFIPPNHRVKKVKVQAHWYTWKEQVLLPRQFNKFPLDLLHFPHFNAPVFYKKKYILTVHDITQKYFPGSGLSSFLRKKAYEFSFASNIRRADQVIAVSHFTKKDILQNFRVGKSKIKVIYEGVDGYFRSIQNRTLLSKIKRKYQIRKPYILYVGVVREHKNIVSLIKAYNLIRKEYKLNVNLIITGSQDPRYLAVQKIIQKLSLQDEIIQTGFVPKEDLRLLYNAAQVFVLPSFREGFGLTPLEAIACQTPVTSTNKTSPKEILDDAALYFNPYDIREIAETIVKVLKNPDLADQLLQRGRKKLEEFSWENCAKKTLKLYSKILRQKRQS